ncbi:Amino acid-binding ACT/ Hypothetical leucine rich repeat kinase [Ectocarpus siliculosus]|uniref:Amino acid-binding ACT/ Hypothetical leucine rich repeat kinase n=1 Tax=Ectocarpus siliculosus TaxID=2880 RepID=D7FHC3_ECTSI|nr:Amino acid-binding ACT/ Hypothetical leucine rich repeat kinase [Ectocarpus siliculosus]|eukprot:CBJ28490.1 Amino acid-binding ACT/ Hypothetical leucine rich repeat kinase [Ectocarpus siliculosus]
MGRRLVARGGTSSASVPTNQQGRGFGDERRSRCDVRRRGITGAKLGGDTPVGSTLARLLRLLSIVLAAVAFGQADVVDEDREYLGILYTSLGGSDWHDNANWTVSGVDVSEWEGVSVATDENGTEYVYEISLGDNHLVGDAFPAVEYGQLLGLQKLSLGGNDITGELPAGLENLVSLTLLDLSDNGFEGEIPPELGSAPSLVRLDLQGNALTGKIPSELGGMAQVGILYLQDNALEDIIPPELGNLASLTQLDLSGNTGLIGPIPPEFGGLVSLKALYMEDNSLTGDIPAELGTLAEGGELQAVDLRNNYLTGEAPEGLEQVSTLLLDGNFVDGYEQRADDSTAPPYPTPAPATPVPTPAPTIATPTPTTASPSLSPSRAPTTPGPTALATPAAATPSPTSASGTPADGALSTPGGGDGDAGGDDADPAMVAGAVVGALVFVCSVCWVCKGCWSWRRRRKEEQGGGSDDPDGTEEVTPDTNVVDATAAPGSLHCGDVAGGGGGGARFSVKENGARIPRTCPSDERTIRSMSEDSDGAVSSILTTELVPALAPKHPLPDVEVQLGSPRRRLGEELPPGVAPPDSPTGVQLGSPATGPAPAADIEIGVLFEASQHRFLEMYYRDEDHGSSSGLADPPGTPWLHHSASVGGGTKVARARRTQQVGRCRSEEVTRQNTLDGARTTGVRAYGVENGERPPYYQADDASSSLDDRDKDGRRSGGGGSGGGTSAGERRMSIMTGLKKAARAAQNSSITGVPEVAMFVETLVTLKADNDGITAAFDTSLQLCSNLAKFLESITEDSATETHRETGRRLLEGVQEQLDAVIDIIEVYKRKTRLGRMWTASMYRTRVEEADASVRRMLEYFNSYVNATSLSEIQKVRAELANHVTDKRLRRQQHLERLIEEEEIPQGSIEIVRDLVIGSGGAGEVYMANYDGFNAAAKVVSIKGGSGAAKQQQIKSFLAEAGIMRRLSKSPHVVRVFGIITSRTSELVLVMEYMSGGDLFSFIKKHREEGLELSAKLTRDLVEDVAHGMAYLHQHSTWHGDLKSLNILLDADCRAKISDFGTSHWTEQTKSNCVQSQTPGTGGFNHFTFHWAAPEVLEHGSASEQLRRASLDISQPGHEHHQADRRSSPLAEEATLPGLSFKSDVYSFGVVVWEVLSRQAPWEHVSWTELVRRVCMTCERPPLPLSAPAELAVLARECWAHSPRDRPTCDQIVAHLAGEAGALNSRRRRTTGGGSSGDGRP